MSAALHIDDLRFTYPARRKQPAFEALRGVALTVRQGQTVAILGPNGSGKSTLFKLICGILPLPMSSHSVDGHSIAVFGSRDPAHIRRSIGVVFQTEGLDRHMTVHENLRDQATLYGLPSNQARQTIDTELTDAGLIDRRDSLVKTLSKGLARRVDLVRAMLHRPRLLLLDEPTVGLDPAARERFLESLDQRARDHNLTILMTTHLVDEADRHDRVVLMHQGRIIADDAPANLRRQAGVRRITVYDGAWNPPANGGDGWRRASNGTGWRLTLDHDGNEARRIAAELTDAGVPFSIAPPTLADVFEQLTGSALNERAERAGSEAES